MAPNKQKGNRSHASPAVDSPPKPSLEDLFLSLDRHVQASEFKQIVKVADQSMVSKAFLFVSPSFATLFFPLIFFFRFCI